MHHNAHETARLFFNTYASGLQQDLKVIDLGSQDVNGSLRDVVTPNVKEYVGLDFAEAKGVDVVLEDPYKFPFEDNTFDVLITSSCLEHSEMFWLSFLEGIRILKPHGLMYCNVPSSCMLYHRYPVDCWRFYPDAGKGLQTWARYNKYATTVLESFIVPPGRDLIVYDWVCVFLKDESYMDMHKNRMIDKLVPDKHYHNGFRFPKNEAFPDGWDEPTAKFAQSVFAIKV